MLKRKANLHSRSRRSPHAKRRLTFEPLDVRAVLSAVGFHEPMGGVDGREGPFGSPHGLSPVKDDGGPRAFHHDMAGSRGDFTPRPEPSGSIGPGFAESVASAPIYVQIIYVQVVPNQPPPLVIHVQQVEPARPTKSLSEVIAPSIVVLADRPPGEVGLMVLSAADAATDQDADAGMGTTAINGTAASKTAVDDVMASASSDERWLQDVELSSADIRSRLAEREGGFVELETSLDGEEKSSLGLLQSDRDAQRPTPQSTRSGAVDFRSMLKKLRSSDAKSRRSEASESAIARRADRGFHSSVWKHFQGGPPFADQSDGGLIELAGATAQSDAGPASVRNERQHPLLDALEIRVDGAVGLFRAFELASETEPLTGQPETTGQADDALPPASTEPDSVSEPAAVKEKSDDESLHRAAVLPAILAGAFIATRDREAFEPAEARPLHRKPR